MVLILIRDLSQSTGKYGSNINRDLSQSTGKYGANINRDLSQSTGKYGEVVIFSNIKVRVFLQLNDFIRYVVRYTVIYIKVINIKWSLMCKKISAVTLCSVFFPNSNHFSSTYVS